MVNVSVHSNTRRLIYCTATALAVCGAAAGDARVSAAAQVKDKADHWAFKPASRPVIPVVKNKSWPRSPIDHFILARLEKEKLKPSPEADPVTLLRRISFDLTGLPPTPEAVQQFLAKKSAKSVEQWVDHLLASPRYGERWGRHWLDVVHYGESHGYDKDKPRPDAWPYRDYVIRSFNQDKPYSRFVEEQLAGDILFPEEPEGVVATGFIAAGPWDFVGHVELPESKTDGLIARYNDRDDMVMTTMSAFQSLTVHCARCHDHKFDPIPQEDYYRLQAVFAGVDRANRPFDSDPKVHAQRQALLARKQTLEVRLKPLNETASKATSPEIKQLDDRRKELKGQLGANSAALPPSPSNGYHSGIEPNPDVEKWVQVDFGRTVAIDDVRLIPARPTDFPDTPGFGFPKRFRVETAMDERFNQRTILADHTASDFPNPGDQPFVVAAKGQSARIIRVTATRLWERTSDFVFALAELQAWSATNNAARSASVSALDSIEAGRWARKYLVDHFTSRQSLDPTNESPAMVAKRKELEAEIAGLDRQRQKLVDALLDEQTRTERARLNEQLAEVNRQLETLPKPQMVYAAAAYFAPSGNFVPPNGPRPVHLLLRGDVKQPGKPMAAGAIQCVPGLAAEFDLPNPDAEGTRRAALARWITDRRNMLGRRSMVNRVWQYHFGRGIVDTPNDFGHMGSAPSHPELLDWLAYWFLDHGESIKQLHKLILTSSTYRQSSRNDPAFAQVDSDNRLLWRMDRQRLDAESFRDTLLSISGKLDLTEGGPSIQQFYFKDDHSPVYDYTRFDVDSPGSNRRSVYRFIVRSVPDPFMECLDSADPSLLTPKRNTTLTALQALATLNNPFVLKQVEHFASRVQQKSNTLAGQIEAACHLALNRRPGREESERLVRYAQVHGLANACRLIINSNEFMFVD